MGLAILSSIMSSWSQGCEHWPAPSWALAGRWGWGAWAMMRLYWEGLGICTGLGFPGEDGSTEPGGHAGHPEALLDQYGEKKAGTGSPVGPNPTQSLPSTLQYPAPYLPPSLGGNCQILVLSRNPLGHDTTWFSKEDYHHIIFITDYP